MQVYTCLVFLGPITGCVSKIKSELIFIFGKLTADLIPQQDVEHGALVRSHQETLPN